MAKILIENGAAINLQDVEGQTPLSWAARYNLCETANLLIKNGAAMNSKDNKGRAPLNWAIANNNKSMIRLLKSNVKSTT